ncbi:MAG: endolytic transglycosylase MltG [Parcubacteria group bacterium]
MSSIKRAVIILASIAVFISGFFYFRYQVYFSHGESDKTAVFTIEKGEGNKIIGENLAKQGLISGKYYFYFYMWSRKLTGKIFPDEYELSGRMTIPEIASVITSEQDKTKKITFPEGWGAKQMAERLTANGLPGDEFLKIVDNPGTLKNDYSFLADPKIKTLEGYLFPDTYFFDKDIDAGRIVKKMLGIFNTKITSQMLADAAKNQKSLNEIIIMASIIENEVKTDEDRALASGLYWNRLKIGQPLQSDITLAYILGEKKKQYSFADTRTVSPYNTYLNKGLPPGPIDNPGLSAIQAAIYPQDSSYNYYLSDPETGKTIFAKTFAEHVANKAKYGL